MRGWFSRARWSSRLLRLPSSDDAGETGLILVQIDGLSRPELQRALDSGRMPFLGKLLRHEGYCLESLYSGVPATTPAVQAELFYGVKTAVPAFSYFNRRLGRVVRMVEAEAAEEVQSHLESNPDNLFEAGSSCTNIYTGGAAEPRFCAAASGWGALFGRATLLGILLFALVNCWNVLRAICLTLLELMKGIAAALWGSLQGFNLWSEIKFIPSRVAVGVLLRDLATMAACMDTTRGLPIIQLNFLGYDEHAHRRGPESEFAQKSLRGIDRCIERLWRAGHESTARMYSLWVYADHGQESSTPYEEITGRTIADVVAEFTGALKAVPESPPNRRASRPGRAERVRYLRRSPAAKGASTNDKESLHDPEVVAIGPLGHLYFQTPRSEEYLAGLAQHLTMKAKVPLRSC